MRLYNTSTRQEEAFAPLHDNTVRMYTCGLTVYNRGHIGNFRTFIFEDVLRAGVASGEFRTDVDPRITALAILGMANAAALWYDKEPGASVERIGKNFAALVMAGIRKPGAAR